MRSFSENEFAPALYLPRMCGVQMLSQVRDLGIVRDLSVGCVVKMNAFK